MTASAPGPRAFDLAEALLVGAGEGHATEPAAALRCRAGPPEFGICAGSVGQTMAGSFVRHNRIAGAPAAVPGMVRALKHAVALTGA